MIHIYSKHLDSDKYFMKAKRVPKAWGEELIIHNQEYCGKLLKFHAGGKFSMHFHSEKDETWYVNKGTFQLIWIDTATAERHIEDIIESDIIHVPRNTPHQLIALQDGEIFEVSTPDYDYDSYRVMKGDSQK